MDATSTPVRYYHGGIIPAYENFAVIDFFNEKALQSRKGKIPRSEIDIWTDHICKLISFYYCFAHGIVE